MTRNMWITVAALVVVVAALFLLVPRTPPSVQVSTDAAKVSIGSDGVSVSVAPSQP